MDDDLPDNNAEDNVVTIAAAIETILDEPIDREPDEMSIDTEYDTELLPLPDGISTSDAPRSDQAGKH